MFSWVRDKEAWFRDKADWSILDGVLPRNTYPTDIDGCLERNNKFLLIEWKNFGTDMDTGQRLALQRAALLPGVFVVCVWGEDSRNVKRYSRVVGGTFERPRNANSEDFRRLVADWWRWADGS